MITTRAEDNYVSALRDPELVAMKITLIQQAPFVWLRGTARLYWRDITMVGIAHAVGELGGRSAKHAAMVSAAGASMTSQPRRAEIVGPPARVWRPYGADRKHSARGIGRAMLAEAEAHGRARGTTHVWLETSNVNVPGVAAYERLGYALCGADSLYYGRYSPGETAIYLAKRLLDR